MGPNERKLRRELRQQGLDARTIDAAWPRWWTDEAESSPSALAELRFTLSRSLGLDPRALVDGDRVRPALSTGARFKGLGAKDASELGTLVSFGQSIARLLLTATPSRSRQIRISASRLREFLLDTGQVPAFRSLLEVCWALDVPVVYLELTPLSRKAMHAMAAGTPSAAAIIIATHDRLYARAAFTLAHELGHVMLGHVGEEGGHLDLEDPLSSRRKGPQEMEADRYALELLTGSSEPVITTSQDRYTPAQLASAAINAGEERGIDPATIAMCDGFRTGDWRRATAACQLLQPTMVQTWREANHFAEGALDWSALGEESGDFLRRVLGLSDA